MIGGDWVGRVYGLEVKLWVRVGRARWRGVEIVDEDER